MTRARGVHWRRTSLRTYRCRWSDPSGLPNSAARGVHLAEDRWRPWRDIAAQPVDLIASATRPPQTLGMDWKVVLAAVGAVVLLVLVTYGSRRVSAGEGRFVWLRSAHLLVGAGMILWGGVYILAHEPLVGVALLVVGGIYAVMLFRFLTRLSRSVTSAGAGGDRAAAMAPAVDFTVTMVGLMLIGGLVAVVGLIVWGVSQAAH